METEGKKSFWQRIRHPYLLRLMDEDTWKSVLNIRLTWLGAFTMATVMFLMTVALLSLLIIYTPIRNILPGYSANLRQQLVNESAKVDSLGTEMELNRKYLSMVRQIVAGEVQVDTIPTMDSLQMVYRDQLLQAKSQAAEEFMAQYEAQERDNFQLFDIQESTPVYTLFRPVQGVVLQHSSPENNTFAITIRTSENESISSVLAGAVVYINYDIDNTYTMMVQHSNSYVSIYRHVGRPIKQVGDAVQAGECIGVSSSKLDLLFELWQNGKNINPEEVIVF